MGLEHQPVHAGRERGDDRLPAARRHGETRAAGGASARRVLPNGGSLPRRQLPPRERAGQRTRGVCQWEEKRTIVRTAPEAGERLQGLFAAQLERERGRQRLRLEGTLQTLAKELLPPRDVGTAIQSIQRGELVKSKLAFQTAMQALQDRQEIQLRREELRQREEVEKVSLKQARSKLVVDMIGRDLGRAILFALGTGEGQGQ